MGKGVIRTAFFSILRFFVLLCFLWVLFFLTYSMIAKIPVVTIITELKIPNIAATIITTSIAYASGIINGIIIGIIKREGR